jgi:hypothetical protein
MVMPLLRYIRRHKGSYIRSPWGSGGAWRRSNMANAHTFADIIPPLDGKKLYLYMIVSASKEMIRGAQM